MMVRTIGRKQSGSRRCLKTRFACKNTQIEHLKSQKFDKLCKLRFLWFWGEERATSRPGQLLPRNRGSWWVPTKGPAHWSAWEIHCSLMRRAELPMLKSPSRQAIPNRENRIKTNSLAPTGSLFMRFLIHASVNISCSSTKNGFDLCQS